MTPFGARLRALRKARNVTLAALAAKLDVSTAYLSALEHGRRGRPGPGLVLEICGHLGLIWDEAEDLKRLAQISQPKVTLDTAGLTPAATELANLLRKRIAYLSDDEIEEMLKIAKE
ncbi:MAG: helix-turn-helix domain-containing protein [Rhodospirillaceae bacterium]